MKYLCQWGTAAIMLMAFTADGQSAPPLNQHPVEKTFLFNQLPEKITVPVSALQSIFSVTVNSNIIVSLGTQLKIEGSVIAKVAVTEDQLSMNIRCTNYQNALLNISRITETDGSFSYIGRMVSLQHGDVLLLWEEKGQYSFIRQKQLLAMVE
ncbi:MAG: hypothetical protein ABIU63_10740 [Chitinophagaceae bacterium]